MSTAAQTIKQLNKKLSERQGENIKLESKLSQCMTILQKKDKLIKELSENVVSMQDQINSMKQELRKKDVLLKTYQNNLYNKNVQLSALEGQSQSQITKINQVKDKSIQELEAIINLQQQQINQLMNDHRSMIDTFRRVDYVNQGHSEERQLLKAFNNELQTQIDDLEGQNEQILLELQQTKTELQLQNQQGQDLFCQLGAMSDLMKSHSLVPNMISSK